MTPTGPFVTSALICERVLQESGNVLSLIRVVDIAYVKLTAPVAPVEETPSVVAVNLFLYLNAKSGGFKGKTTIAVKPRWFVGESVEPDFLSLESEFDGVPENGVNFILQLTHLPAREGVMMIDVFVSGELATSVPLSLKLLPADRA